MAAPPQSVRLYRPLLPKMLDFRISVTRQTRSQLQISDRGHLTGEMAPLFRPLQT
jgi:hypothetical protein